MHIFLSTKKFSLGENTYKNEVTFLSGARVSEILSLTVSKNTDYCGGTRRVKSLPTYRPNAHFCVGIRPSLGLGLDLLFP